MEGLDAQLLGTVVLTSGVAVAMAWLGTRMGLLESRARSRRCPSCGLVIAGTRCRCTS